MRKLLQAAVAAAAVVLFAQTATAQQCQAPSWLTFDAGKQTVALHVIAAFNGNNGTFNFNGYYDGRMTMAVPSGWTVTVDFENPDAEFAHSVVLTRPYAKDQKPQQAGHADVALPRAYTRSPEQGCFACQETIKFKARKAGDYYFLCGVTTHAVAGMWVHFKVEDGLAAPYVVVDPGTDDQPGRP